jgi:hypothetical protein
MTSVGIGVNRAKYGFNAMIAAVLVEAESPSVSAVGFRLGYALESVNWVG